MKTLNKEIVKKVAENLLIANGKTTTLEVKNKLRARNYFALQIDISILLDHISEEEGWYYDYNGVYRTYYLENNLVSNFENNLKVLLFDFQFSLN
jgi:hypothetical protein